MDGVEGKDKAAQTGSAPMAPRQQAVGMDITHYLLAAGNMRMQLVRIASARLPAPWQAVGSKPCLIELYATPPGVGHPASIWMASEDGRPNWRLSDFLNANFPPANADAWDAMRRWLDKISPA